VVEKAPEGVLVFSSDFPHPEGTKDPKKVFEDLLAGWTPHAREQFYGGSMGEVMGI
jgi:hypothetical protein